MQYAPELLYSALAQSTDDYIYWCNWKTGEFRYPKEMVRLFGLPGEVVKHPLKYWKEIVHPDDWELFFRCNRDLNNEANDSHCIEFRARTVDGEYIWMRCKGQLMRDREGEPELFAGIMQEMGKANKIDHLTQLYNSQEFFNTLRNSVTIQETENVGIMILDIDNFRLINEMYTREFGDFVLRKISKAVQKVVPDKDHLYKLDKDRMGILLRNSSEEEVKALYKNIQNTLLHMEDLKEYSFKIQVSAGCSWYPKDGEKIEQLFQYAEYALQNVKENGKNKLSFINEEILMKKKEALELFKKLQKAVDEDYRGFYLHYQPMIDGDGKRIRGVEALMRWKDEEGNFVPPVKILPVLEKHGMVVPFGKWVARTAMHCGKKWVDQDPDFQININASAIELANVYFADEILEIAREEEFPCKNLIVELTESCAVENLDIFWENFLRLRRHGIRVALDDFGTGYSSLQRLKDIPVDMVKIDRSFIENISDSEFNRTFISFVIAISHIVGIEVCLEGMETQGEFTALRGAGLDYIQGYYFGKPVQDTEISSMLEGNM